MDAAAGHAGGELLHVNAGTSAASLRAMFFLQQGEELSVAEGDRPLFALNTTRPSRKESAPAGAGRRKLSAMPSANRNAGAFA
ncbi:MAG TPA: hypothetical protein VNE18_04430, partial [Rhodanobacter sp.]|nr:hypothetical protein [Rhodanobacter sp.]